MKNNFALIALALVAAHAQFAKGALRAQATAAPSIRKRVFPTGSEDASKFLATVSESQLSEYFSWAGVGDDSFTTRAESFVSQNADQISEYFKSHSIDTASASEDVGKFATAASGGPVAIGAGGDAGASSETGSASDESSAADSSSGDSGASSTEAPSSDTAGASDASSTREGGPSPTSSGFESAATTSQASNGAFSSMKGSADQVDQVMRVFAASLVVLFCVEGVVDVLLLAVNA